MALRWALRQALQGSMLGLGVVLLAATTPLWAQAPAMALAAAAPAVTKIFPLVEVHKGLHGVAYTVFEGVDPEPMPLVILAYSRTRSALDRT